MARIKTVTLEDDLDGSEATQTVGFGIDGVLYDIDLNDKNAEGLRETLQRYVENARLVGGKRPKSKSATNGRAAARVTKVPAAQPGATSSKEVNTAIREWARKKGHTLADRGRIPAYVVDAFNEAHA